MFKSTDAGKTWTHIGLEATRQIGRVVVDPANPNRVYVAALGHVYDPNPERGVYRSTDGGATWKKVLFKIERSRQRRRHRRRHRSQESARALRLAVGDAPSAVVGLRAHQPARRRPLQIHRRRRHLEAVDRRAAHRRLRRQDRHRRFAQQSESPLGRGRSISAPPWRPASAAAAAGREAGAASPPRRSLHLRRRRRHLEAGQLREPALGPRLVFRAGHASIPRIPTAPTSSTPPPT